MPPMFDVVFTDREVTDYRVRPCGDQETMKRLNATLRRAAS